MLRPIVLLTAAMLACSAPVVTATPTVAPSGRPRVNSVVAVGDSITVAFSRPMFQIGEGSGVEMIGTYQLDGRALPAGATARCHTRDCLEVGVALPAGTLVVGTTHMLRITNAVAQAGPGIDPDPTTVTFTVVARPN